MPSVRLIIYLPNLRELRSDWLARATPQWFWCPLPHRGTHDQNSRLEDDFHEYLSRPVVTAFRKVFLESEVLIISMNWPLKCLVASAPVWISFPTVGRCLKSLTQGIYWISAVSFLTSLVSQQGQLRRVPSVAGYRCFQTHKKINRYIFTEVDFFSTVVEIGDLNGILMLIRCPLFYRIVLLIEYPSPYSFSCTSKCWKSPLMWVPISFSDKCSHWKSMAGLKTGTDALLRTNEGSSNCHGRCWSVCLYSCGSWFNNLENAEQVLEFDHFFECCCSSIDPETGHHFYNFSQSSRYFADIKHFFYSRW